MSANLNGTWLPISKRQVQESDKPRKIRAAGLDMGYGGRDHASYIVGDFDLESSSIHLLDHYRTDAGMAVMVAQIKRMQVKWGAHKIASYVGGQEMEVVRLMSERGLWVVGMPARVNKFLRAQRTIAAWNDKRIIVPKCDWGIKLADRAKAFTGEDGGDDDDIDALVSLWDYVAEGRLKLSDRFTWRRM